MDAIFERLVSVIAKQQELIDSISEKLEKIESIGGGGGSASIEDYVSGKDYERNTLLVDTNTETVYRVISKYKSVDIDTDTSNGNLKLVGFESQMVTFSHNPTQAEIDALPDDVVVTVYSPSDTPYLPDTQG
jgi:hypothetical protein